MPKEVFTPYIDGAVPLSAKEIDAHLQETKIAAYGTKANVDVSAFKNASNNTDALRFETDSGRYELHASVLGDVTAADTVMVKCMPWSDDPVRGFEMLRASLIAGTFDAVGSQTADKRSVAVLGISLPGMGLTDRSLTKEQVAALRGLNGSFESAAKAQWKAIETVLAAELSDTMKDSKDLRLVLTGSSMGASQAVSLLATKPEHLHVEGLGLMEPLGLRDKAGHLNYLPRYIGTGILFLASGSKNFKQYTSVNPYNEHESLGNGSNLAHQIPRQLSTHAGAAIKALGTGGDTARIKDALNEYGLNGLPIHITTAGESRLSPAGRVEKAKRELGKIAAITTTTLEGHTHAVQENLANARKIWRGFAV